MVSRSPAVAAKSQPLNSSGEDNRHLHLAYDEEEEELTRIKSDVVLK